MSITCNQKILLHCKWWVLLQSLANFNQAFASYRLESSRVFLEQSYQSTKLDQIWKRLDQHKYCIASKYCIAINWGFPILNLFIQVFAICIKILHSWSIEYFHFELLLGHRRLIFKLTSERGKDPWAFAWNTRPLAWVDLWGSSHFVNTRVGKLIHL